MEGGGFLNLFSPDKEGSAHLGYLPSGDPTAPAFSVGAHAREAGFTFGATPMGRPLVRTTFGTEGRIEQVDYEFDGEELARTPPR